MKKKLLRKRLYYTQDTLRKYVHKLRDERAEIKRLRRVNHTLRAFIEVTQPSMSTAEAERVLKARLKYEDEHPRNVTLEDK